MANISILKERGMWESIKRTERGGVWESIKRTVVSSIYINNIISSNLFKFPILLTYLSIGKSYIY